MTVVAGEVCRDAVTHAVRASRDAATFRGAAARRQQENPTGSDVMTDHDTREEPTEDRRQEDGQREQGVLSEDSEDLSSPQFTERAGDGERQAHEGTKRER